MKVKIKHVDHWKDRHGKERFYFRKRQGQRIPLRGPLGSPEFWGDYNNAANGVTKVKPTFKRAQPESMRWLVEQYYQSSSYKEISDGYRKTRRGILDKFCEEHGHKRYAQLRPRHIRKFRDAMMDRPGSANNLLKALRQVFKYAVNYDYLDTNPVAVVERLKPKDKDGFHAWTLEEIEQFESTHPMGCRRCALLRLVAVAEISHSSGMVSVSDLYPGLSEVRTDDGSKNRQEISNILCVEA